MNFDKVKKSKNFEDRTNEDKTQYDWNYLLGTDALNNQRIDPNEALRGLSPEEVNKILFQKALEEFGGYFMNKWPEPNRYPQGRGPLKSYK